VQVAVHTAPAGSPRQIRGARRSVTNPPRPRDAPDLRPLIIKVDEMASTLSEVLDHMRRQDARASENVKRNAETAEALETLRSDHERHARRVENTTSEILATQTNTYRELDTRIKEAKGLVDEVMRRVDSSKSEDVKAATEGAARGAAEGAKMDGKVGKGAGLLAFLGASILVLTQGNKALGVVLKLLHIPLNVGED